MRRILRKRWVALGAMVPLVVLGSMTAKAAGPNITVGAGDVAGTVDYTTGNVPVPPARCSGASAWHWSLTTNLQAVAIRLVDQNYAGPVSLGGNGSSSCADFSADIGSLSGVTISGSNVANGGSISCTQESAISGIYIRIGVHFDAEVAADCLLNGVGPASTGLQVAFEGEWVPAGAAPFDSFAFSGVFAIF